MSGKSIFHNSGSADIGKPDEIDDTTALMDHIRQQADADLSVIEQIEVDMPMLAMGYQPGDRVVCSPDSRDILGIRGDRRSIFWVERVRADFVGQSTSLRILRRRIYG